LNKCIWDSIILKGHDSHHFHQVTKIWQDCGDGRISLLAYDIVHHKFIPDATSTKRRIFCSLILLNHSTSLARLWIVMKFWTWLFTFYIYSWTVSSYSQKCNDLLNNKTPNIRIVKFSPWWVGLVTRMGRQEMCVDLWCENFVENDHLEDKGEVNTKIMSKNYSRLWVWEVDWFGSWLCLVLGFGISWLYISELYQSLCRFGQNFIFTSYTWGNFSSICSVKEFDREVILTYTSWKSRNEIHPVL
jgi:hypothetical protein